MRVNDITGMKFNKLTVIERTGRPETRHDTHAYWLCKCECGNYTVANSYQLRIGDIKSCGCWNDICRHVSKNSKHNMCNTRIYRIWHGIKQRCHYEKDRYYPRYGDKGIIMYKEWRESFDCFKEWAYSNGYADSLSLDRINNKGNYEPNNCRWATAKTQANNRHNTRFVEYKGIKYKLSEFAEQFLDINVDTFYSRVQRGMSVEDAMSTNKRKNQFG